MIRLTLIFGLFAVIGIGAFRNWYYALCGLVVATVLLQHPSMPRTLFDVQGLNPWNVAFACILLARLLQRRGETRRAPAPAWLRLWFFAYAVLVLVAGLAGAFDHASIKGVRWSFTGALVDGLVNPMKYLILASLFFSAAATPARLRAAVLAATGSGLVYGLMMFKSMQLRVFTIDYQDARRLTDKLIGLYATDLSQLLAFAILGAFIAAPLIAPWFLRVPWTSTAIAIIPCFISLKSRGGFVAFAAGMLTLALFRSRTLLLVLPLLALAVIWWDPDVGDRLLAGAKEESLFHDAQEYDWDEMSSGRLTNLWPPVLAQILKAPVLGHGRYAMLRENIFPVGFVPPTHPHNAYLEILLDAGVVGLLICVSFLVVLARVSIALARSPCPRASRTLGAISLLAVATLATSSLFSQSFYLTQSAVPYACLFATTLRAWYDRALLTAECSPSISRFRVGSRDIETGPPVVAGT